MQLQPLPYHRAVADLLEQAEPDLWAWFRSRDYSEKYQQSTDKDLLATAIRLEPTGPNERRYRLAEQARDALGLSAPITLYQMQDVTGTPNAFLVYKPGAIVIAFAGRVLELLDTDAELLDLLGHEISHSKLLGEADGRFHTVDRLLHWLIRRDGCPPEFAETWRRTRLYTEIYCDLGGLLACGDRDATIRGLVKSLADFKDADAASYLKQAEELLAKEPGSSRGLTHPELHIRALAVANAQTLPPDDFDALLRRMIAGPIELGGLDLIDQRDLARLTRQLLDRVLSDEAATSEAGLAHARQMFHDYSAPATASAPLPPSKDRLAASAIDYLAYVLLDLATADDTSARAAIGVSALAADEVGIGARFREIARQELKGRRMLLAGLTPRAA